MKKLIASASLVAVGAASLQGAYAPGLDRTQTTKPWSISGAIRGFYDDNYDTRPSNDPLKRDSFGFEVIPSVSVNLPLDQTYIGASYTYSMKYYEDRDDDSVDQMHDFNLKLDHQFNPRFNLKASESFIYSQEPELVDPNAILLRQDSEGFHNIAIVDFTGLLTERVGFGVGYQNNWFDYQQSGDGSRSALLDRVEQYIHLDARYLVRENLTALAGYQFGTVHYTAGDALSYYDPNGLQSDDRDSTSHYFYVGGDGSVSERLTLSGRLGVQYTDFDELDETSTSPYVDISATYNYLPGSSFRVGVRHFRNSTDQIGSSLDPVTDQESTAVYGLIDHRITSRLQGQLFGQYQHGEFNGGSLDKQDDNIFLVGVNLNYMINEYLSAEAGYNYDKLNTDISGRSFTRNRVFLGLKARY